MRAGNTGFLTALEISSRLFFDKVFLKSPVLQKNVKFLLSLTHALRCFK